jgi:hypothetical protein
MIQTQLLRLDPPYQIISAGGRVGIQIATLIVANEVDMSHSRFGHISNYVEYHSFPVVSYGLKQGLEEEMKYNNNPMDYEADWAIRRRMQPEGAVWSGVEVKDVRVLGIAGAKNDSVALDYFVYLIPTVYGYDPSLHVWDSISTSRVYELYKGLGNVGLRTVKLSDLFHLGENTFPVKFELENNPTSDGNMVRVVLKEKPDEEHGCFQEDSVEFRCPITLNNSESISECASTIAEALCGLSNFLPTQSLKIWSNLRENQKTEDNSNLMKQLTLLVQENYRDLLYPHHD